MAILKQKISAKTRAIGIRIDVALAAQVDALKADAEAAGYTFDLSDVCAKALAAAVKAGRAELASECAQSVHTPPAAA